MTNKINKSHLNELQRFWGKSRLKEMLSDLCGPMESRIELLWNDMNKYIKDCPTIIEPSEIQQYKTRT